MSRSHLYLILTLLVIAVFAFLLMMKASLPHFWDEAWVYAPAIKAMAERIPSIFPHHLPIDLSRGHPLGYHFLGSIWVKVFGPSNTAMHGFAILVSSSALLLLYMLMNRLSTPEAGFFTVLLLISQPLFVAQAFMVYPEMLLMVGLITSLFGYFNKNHVLFALGLVISFLAKETGLVFIVAFIVLDILRLLADRDSYRVFMKYAIPVLLIGLYLGVVYLNFGWVFYPGHTELMSLELADIRFNLRKVYRVLIEGQSRGYWIYPILGLGVLFYVKLRLFYRVLICAVLFSAYKVFVWKWVVPEAVYWLVILVVLLIPVWIWYRVEKTSTSDSGFPFPNFLLLVWILIPGFILFSALNFFTPRYLLSMLVPLVMVVSLTVWRATFLTRWMKITASLLLLIPGFLSMASTRNSGEVNLGLFDDLKVQERMVDWFLTSESLDASVCANFVTQTYFKVKEAGYVKQVPQELAFQDVCDDSCNGEYLIVTKTSSECRKSAQEGLKRYSLIYTDTVGNSYASVYKKGEL